MSKLTKKKLDNLKAYYNRQYEGADDNDKIWILGYCRAISDVQELMD